MDKIISIQGSTEVISEFLFLAINKILYLRQIYSAEQFQREVYYDLHMQIIVDSFVKEYLNTMMKSVKEFLAKNILERLVVVIIDDYTFDVLERWQFNFVQMQNDKRENDKSLSKIQKEILNVFNQITNSVTILPIFENPCSFNILLYTDINESLPNDKWIECGPKLIDNSEEITISSFSTQFTRLQPVVTYKRCD